MYTDESILRLGVCGAGSGGDKNANITKILHSIAVLQSSTPVLSTDV